MVKKILIGLGILVVVIILIGFMMPGKVEITKSISVNAPAEYLFEEINDLEKLPKWSYWDSLYKGGMTVAYGDIKAGAGAVSSWTGEESGDGKMMITESIPNQSIKMDLDFMEDGTAKSWYTFEPEGEGTKLTSGFAFDVGMNPFMRLMAGLFARPEMNKAFDHNLSHLKTIAEAKPRFSVKITEENTQPISYVGLSSTMSFEDQNAISAQMGKSYGELMTALEKAKVQMTGPALCLYPISKWNEATKQMEMICALPVAPDAKVPAKYKVMQISGGRAVKAIHKGAYNKLETTHAEIAKYIEFKMLLTNGDPWEVYITDPMVEKDTVKWVTEVYYPVKE